MRLPQVELLPAPNICESPMWLGPWGCIWVIVWRRFYITIWIPWKPREH